MAAAREYLKAAATAAVDNNKEELSLLSGEIWKNPELGFKEHRAHELLTSFLERKGFAVERSFTGIETAFRATFGSGRPNVCVICEYDALPEIGHACGHNLIAEAGVAAGLGLKAALECGDAPKGRVTIMGTPDEEKDGGKVYLIQNGAFEDVDIAMMVHPSPFTIIMLSSSALIPLNATYTGKASHAAGFPWEGVNALDAAVMAYNSISVLRQQMKPTWRVHGVFTNGGVKPNIIPEKSKLEYYLRALTVPDLETLKEKVVACFQAAALATGCEVKIEQPPTESVYLGLNSNPVLAQQYQSNLKTLGVEYQLTKGEHSGSTDMGNVSYIVPSIHPMFKIGAGEINHSRDFTQVANTPDAHSATLTAAKAMAYTCIDVLTTEGLLAEIKANFEASRAQCGSDVLTLATGRLKLN